MRSYLGIGLLLCLGLVIASPARAQPVAPDCPSGPICTDPGLTFLADIMAQAVAAQNTALEATPGRLRQAQGRRENWRRRLDRDCGFNLGCLQRAHLKQINDIRGDAPPLVWQLTPNGSMALAEAAPLGEIPSLPMVGISSDFVSLVGYWRGTTVCSGRNSALEIVIEPGYAGRLFGFIGAWNNEQTPDNPGARDEFILLDGGDGVHYRLRTINSRMRISGPHVRFGDMELSRDAGSGAMELTSAGGNCDPVSLASAPRSESLDGLIAAARAVPNPRWSWPYDPRDIPAPADHAFCSALISWADHYFDHYPETRGIHPEDLTPVAMLDLPGFISLLGAPYDALYEQARRDFITRMNNDCAGSLVSRSLLLHGPGVLGLMRSQERAPSHQLILDRLAAVRAGRDWMAESITHLSTIKADPAHYLEARAIEGEAVDILAPLLAGEIAAFGDEAMAARSRSAPAYARAEVDRLFATSEDARALILIDAITARMSEVIADMEPEAAQAFFARVDEQVAAVVARELPLQLAALTAIAADDNAIADGRTWYGDFIIQFGAYSDRPEVQQTLDVFRQQRLQLTSQFSDRIVAEIEEAESESALTAYVDTNLIPDIDTADPRVGPAYLDRVAGFERERALRGYSPLERSLANNAGVITVPATYPEPTEGEVALATARAYGRYGGNRLDGSFTYGVFRESAADMRVSSVEKSACTPEPGIGYRCVVRINFDIRMPGAVSALMGSQDIGDMAMLYLQDQANARSSSFVEHVFMLTPDGWQSPTLMRGADAGIAAGVNAIGQVATGVGCALADLEC